MFFSLIKACFLLMMISATFIVCTGCIHMGIEILKWILEEAEDIKYMIRGKKNHGNNSTMQIIPKANEFIDKVRKYYLVQNEYGDMLVACWDGKGWTQMYQHEYVKDKIVAYRELPNSYKDYTSEKELNN